MLNYLKPIFLLGLYGSISHAQFVVDLSVDVTENDGIYTYSYTLENSFFSFQNVNVLLLTTGKRAEVTEMIAPDGWVGDYEKDGGPTPTFQASFLAGDGLSCGDHVEAEISPDSTATFTIKSTWAPESQPYNIGRLVSDPILGCAWEGTRVEGMIASPSIPATTGMFAACDFNQDGECDLRDINNLASTIALGDHDETYDLTNDQLVDLTDLGVFLGQTGRINGDADFNGRVEFADFLTLSGNFGLDGAFWSDGDFSADGRVAFADFLILSGNFGQGEAATASVPEPHSQGLLMLGAFGLLLLRTRSR